MPQVRIGLGAGLSVWERSQWAKPREVGKEQKEKTMSRDQEHLAGCI